MTTRKQLNRERKRDRHGSSRSANGQVARPVTTGSKARRVRPVASGSYRIAADGSIWKGRRQIRPPALKRIAPIMAFFAPVTFLLVHFTMQAKGATILSELGLTAVYTAFGLSTLVLFERSAYRRAQRQLGLSTR